MKELRVSVHYIVSEITNSSTEIYAGCHNETITFAKKFFQEILDSSGCNKKVDDIFEFSIESRNEINDYNVDALLIKVKKGKELGYLWEKIEKIFDINAGF